MWFYNVALALCLLSLQLMACAGEEAECYTRYNKINDQSMCLEEKATEVAVQLRSMPTSQFVENTKQEILKWQTQANRKLYEFHSLAFYENNAERSLCGTISRGDNVHPVRFIKTFNMESMSFTSTYLSIENPQSEIEMFKAKLFETSWSVKCANAMPVDD